MRDLRYRPICTDDWRKLQRFHRRLSDSTVELRFHGAKRELSVPMAHYFTSIDGRDNVAIVATTGTWGRIVAVARYCRVAAATAEVAFVIEDEYQHHGIGRKLMRRLCAAARANGISRFVASVLPGNTAMLHLLESTGETHIRLNGGVWDVETDLPPVSG